MAIQQIVTGLVPVQQDQQPQPVRKTGEVAWMPLNPDWPTRLQHLYMAVQEAQSCHRDLGEARPSRGAAVLQQPGVSELQVQAYQLWQSLERYVGLQIEAWEREVRGSATPRLKPGACFGSPQ